MKYVIMYKRTTLLHYILLESRESMIRKVYTALQCTAFYHLVVKDIKELYIIFIEEEFSSFSYNKWKKLIQSKIEKFFFYIFF